MHGQTRWMSISGVIQVERRDRRELCISTNFPPQLHPSGDVCLYGTIRSHSHKPPLINTLKSVLWSATVVFFPITVHGRWPGIANYQSSCGTRYIQLSWTPFQCSPWQRKFTRTRSPVFQLILGWNEEVFIRWSLYCLYWMSYSYWILFAWRNLQSLTEHEAPPSTRNNNNTGQDIDTQSQPPPRDPATLHPSTATYSTADHSQGPQYQWRNPYPIYLISPSPRPSIRTPSHKIPL